MKPTIDEILLSEIVFDEVIYPRKDHDPVLVQRYETVLEEIEAAQKFIAVSADNKLLDGKHRWLAYRKRHNGGDATVKILRYNVSTPHEQLKLAAQLNSSHGWQLADDDKKMTAVTLYSYGCTYDDIAATLSVGKKKVSDWLSRTVKEEKDRRNEKILEMWLSCHTQQEMADSASVTQPQAKAVCDGFIDSVLQNQTYKSRAEHATDFDPPIYNVWKQQTKSEGSSHFGNSEVRWVDNLLYLYTSPFDVVIDPFAGGGSTIDICKKRFRRYFVSDRKPIVEREKEIRQHDLIDGAGKVSLPKPPQWKDVKLVYLDPPYWKQAEGEYSDDPTDLANMPLDEFSTSLAGIINGYAKKITDAYIAMIISPTQWKSPERAFTDHVGDMLREVKLPVHMRFSAPYESQQCNAQMVEWSKANKIPLVLTREIVVWRVS